MHGRRLIAVLLTALIIAMVPSVHAQAPETIQVSTGGPVAQGDAARLAVVCRCEADMVRVASPLFDTSLDLERAADGTWRGVIGVDVFTAPGRHPLTVTIARAGAAPLAVAREVEVITKDFPTRTLTVEPRFVDPPPAEVERLTAEAVRLNRIYATVSPRSPMVPMREPLRSAVTGVFGSHSVFNGQARNPHAGVDFRGGVGTPIAAPAAGTVVMAEDLYFTGQTVVIDHGGGMYSILAHMSEIRAQVGQAVGLGDLVGLVGATGRVTGPHLHWSIRLLGNRVDPLSVVRVLGGN
jgi:murein DD-endopeptidase MepM/ murein hydrolase activator NlpD